MTKKTTAFLFILIAITAFNACQKPEIWDDEINEWLSGGKQTVFDQGAGAFGAPFPVMDGRNEMVHEIGDLAFEQTFVSSGNIHPGLGPVYNSVSCASCHISDGRGTPIGPGINMISLLIRLSVAGSDEHGGPLPAPAFGGQLQQNAIAGAAPEANVALSYTENTYFFADGTTYSLQTPEYSFSEFYTSPPAAMLYSPRIAPPVFGLGLLEAVPEAEILLLADEFDSDGDGISGKPNYVWDVLANASVLGRFGWKCGAPSLLQQVAGAYHEDMGITSFLFPMESSAGQSQEAADAVAEPEISDSLLHAVSFYVATLAVPARRKADDAMVQQGKKIFLDAGCSSCHRPSMRTGVNVAFSEVSNQIIFPYSDLLLHDMGDGLTDNRPDFLADGSEWRTPPLWGIGLTDVVNGHNHFLHDGRARSLLEAVMWHGGEAENARNAVANLPTDQRLALIIFLESL